MSVENSAGSLSSCVDSVGTAALSFVTNNLTIHEFICNTSGTKIVIENTTVPAANLNINTLAVFGEVCVESSATNTITVSDFTAQVGETPPDPFRFTTTVISSCGSPTTFSLKESHSWISFTIDADTGEVTITVAPSSDADAGTYTMTLQLSIDDYPSVAASETTFSVTITAATPVAVAVPEVVVNTAPVFASELSVFQLVFKTNEPESWSYTFPDAEDEDGDDVETIVDVDTATFVSFDGTNTLSIADLSDASVVEGSFNIDVTLDDRYDQTAYELTLNIMPPFAVAEEEGDADADAEEAEEEAADEDEAASDAATDAVEQTSEE